MRALGDPQASLAAVHIVGTNGKSSTTRMCAAALAASGLRVGAYLSPHVARIEERVQVDGLPLWPRASTAWRPRCSTPPTGSRTSWGRIAQFEALTAIAFLAFGEESLDAACVEAGLGGRLDATNVLDARVVGLTNVGLDHTALLGDTPELILAEKIAVVSPGAIVVLGELSDELARLATADAKARGARKVLRVSAGDLEIADGLLAAGYQRPNAALALACARAFLAPSRLDVRRLVAPLPMRRRPGDSSCVLDLRSSCATARTTRTGCARSSPSWTRRSAIGARVSRSSRCRPTRTAPASSTCSPRTSTA